MHIRMCKTSGIQLHARKREAHRQGIQSPEENDGSWGPVYGLNDATEEECQKVGWIVPELWCLLEEGTLTRRLKVSGWKMKESSIGRRMELVRWNMPQDEIRKIGTGLVVQWFKRGPYTWKWWTLNIMYSTQIASVCSFIGLRNVHCTYMYVNVYAVVFLFFKPETGRKSCAWWGLAQAWMWTFPKQLMWDMADFFFLLSLWVWQNKVPCCEHDLYTDTEPSVSPKLKSSLYIKNKFWRWLLLIFVTLVELLNLNLLYSWWHLVTDGSHLLGWTVWNKIVLQFQHNYFFFLFFFFFLGHFDPASH